MYVVCKMVAILIKSPETRLHVKQLFQASVKDNIKALYHWSFVKGNHRSPKYSRHKGLIMWKRFPCHDSIIFQRLYQGICDESENLLTVLVYTVLQNTAQILYSSGRIEGCTVHKQGKFCGLTPRADPPGRLQPRAGGHSLDLAKVPACWLVPHLPLVAHRALLDNGIPPIASSLELLQSCNKLLILSF